MFHTRCHRFIEGTCDVIEPPVVELEVGHIASAATSPSKSSARTQVAV